MSRQGNKPINLPKDVEVTVNKDNEVVVKGPKGSISQLLSDGISINTEEGKLTVQKDEKILSNGAVHGLMRALIANMVEGVSKGYSKQLQLIGTGYRAQAQGNKLDVKVGYSHPTIFDVPEGLQVAVDKKGIVTISGVDKQKVGQFAAEVRACRPPEPYKGKGIRYVDEYVRKKAGKAAKAK